MILGASMATTLSTMPASNARSEHARTALDEYAHHLAGSQQVHQGVEVDTARSLIDDLDVHPGRAQPLHAVGTGTGGGRDQRGAGSGLEHASIRGDAERAVHDDAQRRAPAFEAGGQCRVIGQHGVDADQNRIVGVPEVMCPGAARFGRDPARFTPRSRDPAIERCGELGRDKRESGGDVLDIELVEPLRLGFAQTHLDKIPAARSASMP